MNYVAPYGSTIFILVAGDSVAVSASGNGAVTISGEVTVANYVPSMEELETAINGQATVGPFDNDRRILIEAGDCNVIYATGISPVLTTGNGLTVQLSGGAIILVGDSAPVDYTDGDPVATGQDIAGAGSLYVRTDTPTLYINTGTAAQPAWSAIALAA